MEATTLLVFKSIFIGIISFDFIRQCSKINYILLSLCRSAVVIIQWSNYIGD